MCFLFLVKFAVRAEQRGHKEMRRRRAVLTARSVVVRVTLRPACSPHCSSHVKTKETENLFLNTRSKNAHDLLVETIEKTSFWKDESTLAFPLFCSFSQYC